MGRRVNQCKSNHEPVDMSLNGRSPRRVASDTLPIQDRGRLAKVVSELVSPFQSQRAASRALHIPQTQLSRMLNRKLGELSRTNARRLFTAIDPARRRTLVRAFVMRSPAGLRRAYVSWIEEQLAAASNGAARRWFRTAQGLSDEERESRPLGKSDRDDERKALWAYVEQIDPNFVREVETASRQVRDRRYRQLILVRILDPLINGPDSGFIEPSWREWRTNDSGRHRLTKFLRLGFDRERLLLEVRLRTSERALNVLASPHDDFMQTYGESAAPLVVRPNPFDLLNRSD